MANKVVFGLENVHVGTYSVDAETGTVTLGTPLHIAGAVNMSLEADSEESVFWADNVKYYTTYSDNGMTGELEMALFPDAFKTQFMNYTTLADGGLAQIKGEQNKDVYIIFEASGDAEHRRCIMYNVSLGQITREYATTTESKEPQTATLPFTVTGDNGTGIVRAEYSETSAGYATLFTAPPVPTLPE